MLPLLPAFHSIVRLKKAGVKESSQSRVKSILCYPAPSWYPLISASDKEKLKQFQQICLRVISPHQEEYESRLAALQVSELNVHLQLCCLRYLQRLKGKEDHPLTDYILNLRDGPESPLQQNHQQGKDTNSTGGQKPV